MFAVQPTSFGTFDEHGADYTPTIAGAYRIAAIRQQEQEGDPREALPMPAVPAPALSHWRCSRLHRPSPMGWVALR